MRTVNHKGHLFALFSLLFLTSVYLVTHKLNNITQTNNVSNLNINNNGASINWTAYSNSELGIIFSYPDYYNLIDNIFYPSNLKEQDYIPNSKIGAILITNKINLNYCNYSDNYKSDAKVLSRNKKLINGIDGIQELIQTKYLGDNGEGYGFLYVTNYCFNIGNKSMTISFYDYNKQPSKGGVYEYNQIFSTVRHNL